MKLTMTQGQKLIGRAVKEVDKNNNLRFGQALWNLLVQDHPDLAEKHHGTKFDFFYTADKGLVFEIFFENYVGDIV